MPGGSGLILAPFCTTTCPNCGYSLEGLAHAGTCPECGRGYDHSAIILYGYGRGSHESIATASPSRVLWVALATSGGVLLQRQMWAPMGVPILLVFAVMVAYLLLRRRSTVHHELVQVRLDERGCVQFDDLAGPSVVRELIGSHGWLAPLAVAVFCVVGFRLHWIDTLACAVWLPASAVATVLLWGPCRRVRRRLREVRESDVADINLAFRRPTKWQDVVALSIHPLASGRHRLSITARGQFLSRNAVDAAIRCTREQAQQLEDVIRRWISCAAEAHYASTGQ